MMNDEKRGFTLADMIIAAGALGGVIAALIPWFVEQSSCVGRACLQSDPSGTNGFAGWGLVYILGLVLVIVLFVLRNILTEIPVPRLPWQDWVIYSALGGLLVVSCLLEALTGDRHTTPRIVPGATYTNTRGWGLGILLALVMGVVVSVGARLKQKDPQPATTKDPEESY